MDNDEDHDFIDVDESNDSREKLFEKEDSTGWTPLQTG